ncbi:MAG TPA: tetratricopeptide repeat protein [Alphaproteobacteria bacterium]|nr:tetratricopeptide repeat protein [Alphaproteobacteria bacterium]
MSRKLPDYSAMSIDELERIVRRHPLGTKDANPKALLALSEALIKSLPEEYGADVHDPIQKRIFNLTLRAAEQDHAAAQFELGRCYYNGIGVKRDILQAAQWWTKAAEQGHADAQYNLGRCYYNGLGVERDILQAAHLLTLAAEQGPAKAQYVLGSFYYHGEGVPQDYSKAAQWWTKAAEQGHADAQYNLGVSYNNGEGVPQDYSQTAKLWRKAAGQDHANAQYGLGISFLRATGIPISPSQAVACFLLSTLHGIPDASTDEKLEEMARIGATRDGSIAEFFKDFVRAAWLDPNRNVKDTLKQIARVSPQSPPNPA